jgi:hypothetical protein
VYLAAERKDKDEIQGSFTPFRMTTSKGKVHITFLACGRILLRREKF